MLKAVEHEKVTEYDVLKSRFQSMIIQKKLYCLIIFLKLKSVGHRLSKKGRINTRVFLQIVILRKFYTAEKTRKTREKWEIAFVLLSSIFEFGRGQPNYK